MLGQRTEASLTIHLTSLACYLVWYKCLSRHSRGRYRDPPINQTIVKKTNYAQKYKPIGKLRTFQQNGCLFDNIARYGNKIRLIN